MNSMLIWETPPGGWAVGIALAIAALAAARHYSVSPARGPSVLRGGALCLLLLTIWRPALRFQQPPVVTRPVRILLDDSLSMASVDIGRGLGESLRIAESLGLRLDMSTDRPTRVIEKLRRAMNELTRANQVLSAARQADPIATQQRQRVATARNAAVTAMQELAALAGRAGCSPETLAALHGMEDSLRDSADPAPANRAFETAVGELRRRADEEDEQAAMLDGVAVDAVRGINDSSRFRLAQAVVRRLAKLLPAGVIVTNLDGSPANLSDAASANSAASPLTAALRDACGRAAAEEDEAVVLISDGRSTESRSLLAPAASANVPVFTVPVAPEDRSPDARVTRIDARPTVLADQTVNVRVRVSQRNAAGRNVRVVLTDGQREIVRPVTLGNDNSFDFNWPDAKPPQLHLTARIDPLEGEIRLQNNSISIDIVVLDRREHVVMFDGPGGRDAAELAAVLSASPWIDLHRHRLAENRETAPDASELATADVIVLTDVPRGSLNVQAWDTLTRTVQVDGKAMLILAGQGDWLAEPAIARRLAPLLPTAPGTQPTWITPPLQVWPVPTRFGADASFLRLDESPEASLRVWLGRPKQSRHLAVGPPMPLARPLLVDRSTQTPLLVESAVGDGRTMLLLTDEIWRWATAADAPDSAKAFWLGMTQALLDLPYAKTAGDLSISVDCAEVPVGRGAIVRMRTRKVSGGPVWLTVSRQGTPVTGPGLRELLPGGGRYATLANLPAGTYTLTLHQNQDTISDTLVVQANDQLELADTTPDAGLMKRIADTTGGAVLSLEEIDRLPDLLTERREGEARAVTYELWCSPYWFAAIVGCLGLEWAWRARVGLA